MNRAALRRGSRAPLDGTPSATCKVYRDPAAWMGITVLPGRDRLRRHKSHCGKPINIPRRASSVHALAWCDGSAGAQVAYSASEWGFLIMIRFWRGDQAKKHAIGCPDCLNPDL